MDRIVIRPSSYRMLDSQSKSNFDTKTGYTFNKTVASVQLDRYKQMYIPKQSSIIFLPLLYNFFLYRVAREHAVNKKSKNYPPFRHVFHMKTSDLNVNNTESDQANTIFRQFQDAIFSREHTYVKTLTKIMFDLLQWQEIPTLSLPKKAP